MTKKVSNNLYQTPTNDNNIYAISCKVGNHFLKLCTLDTRRKTILIRKNQRRYSKKLNAFGIPYDLLACSSLNYNGIFIETQRKFYFINRAFWKWNGTLIDSTIRRSYLNLENFRIVNFKGGIS